MSTDRRSCIRLSPPGIRCGLVAAGGTRTPALILNESARGIGVLVDFDDKYEVGTIVTLETGAGRQQVRIARATEVENGWQLGLERIADLATPPSTGWHLNTLLIDPARRTISIILLVLSLAVLAGMLAPIARRHLHFGPRFSGGPLEVPHATTRSPNPAAKSKPLLNPRTARGVERVADKIAADVGRTEAIAADALAKLTALPPERLLQWRSALRELPWEPDQLLDLVSLDLARLGLSIHQQERIAAIIRSVVGQLQALADRLGDTEAARTAAAQIEQHAVAQIHGVFTSGQREKWETLSPGAAGGTST